VIKLLAKGSTCDARSYIDEILSEIASWHEAEGGGTNRGLIVQAENARAHTAGSILRSLESCGMVRAPDSPISPDLAGSDFVVVGYLKSMLRGRHFGSGDEGLAAIIDPTGTNEKVTFETVFLEWMDRLAESISTNGDYVTGDK
jgi:hypothetical protein